MEIEGEKAYPIYRISARWIQDGERDHNFEWQYEGLPEGRIRNSTSFYKMWKIRRSRKQLDEFVKKWFNGFLKHKKDIKNPELIELKIEFKEYETWLLTWFQHQTFDTGQTDQEALWSFERFVMRKEKLIYEKGEEAYCLMGAEDRWRWHGTVDGDPKNSTDPPCRCKHCKKQGLIRIAH